MTVTREKTGRGQKGSPSQNIRELALDILYEVLEEGAFSHVVLNQALSKYQYLEKPDRAFVSRVTEGTLEYVIQIDYVLDLFSKTKSRQMKPFIRTLLRMSVYQILYMERIPDAAVCNEAVKLAEKRRFQGLKGFVNGVLRTVSREKGRLSFSEPWVKYSVPPWLLPLWGQDYGQDTIERMLSYFLSVRPITARFNVSLMEKGKILESLGRQGVLATESPYLDTVYALEGFDYLEALEAFQKGWLQPQDLSSCFAALGAAPKAGDVVLDVCGAPGGKGLHMADLLKGTGHVIVRDISQRKVGLIRENIARCGFSNMEAQTWDALVLDESFVEKADIVLADLPCSGLGVLGRKPDIKLKMKPEALASLAGLQREILSVVYQYVKPGGILAYSTCTIDRQENEENMAWFLEKYPFRPVNIKGRLQDKLNCDTMEQGYVQLLPGVHPCDGFFLSVMQRI